MTHDVEALLEFAVDTARAAGEVILSHDAPVPGPAPRMKRMVLASIFSDGSSMR